MSEENIMLVTVSLKISALEEVLTPQQLIKYRALLLEHQNNFRKIWGKYLTAERLEEALSDFEI